MIFFPDFMSAVNIKNIYTCKQSQMEVRRVSFTSASC